MPARRTITFFILFYAKSYGLKDQYLLSLSAWVIKSQRTCFHNQRALPLLRGVFCFTTGDGTEDRCHLEYLMGGVGTLESQWTSGVPLALPICQGCPVASGCWHAFQTLLAWGIVRGDNHSQNPGAEASQTSAPFFGRIRSAQQCFLGCSPCPRGPWFPGSHSLQLVKTALIPISYARFGRREARNKP